MATQKKERKSLFTPIGRAAFCHLFEPHAIEEGKPKMYSITLAFDAEKTKELRELKLACFKAGSEKFGKTVDELKVLHKKGKFHFPWRPNSDYDEYGEPFNDDGQFISLRSKDQPQVVDKRAKPIIKASEVYSGMYARATYAVWPFDNNGKKGVTLLLNNVQKASEGERLAGRPDAEDEFEAVEGGDEADDDNDDDADV